MIECRWVGPLFDTSGYASATRGYINALLDRDDIDLTLHAVSFEQQRTTHGSFQNKVTPYLDKQLSHRIQVTHLTPENYPNLKGGQGIYNVAYTVWETDLLPDKWVALCNEMDEIWVPSAWNKEVFTKSGVTKPIYVVPHVIDIPDLSDAKHLSMGFDKDKPEPFLFYSIFQWIERKNPLALLKAYLTEFSPDENVCLALKSYRLNVSVKEQNIIKTDIANLKTALNLREYPPMRFFGTLLPAEYIRGLHKRGDCFVLPHRGEGFGIPHAEAMALGKPVIATQYGGNLEFMNSMNSYLINYQEIPVSNMLFPNYHAHMTWADPDIMHLRQLMRYVYENREEAQVIGHAAQQYIRDHLNAEKIGDLIVNRLRQIEASL